MRVRRRTVFSEHAVILEDVKNSTHLRKDENSRSLRLHRFEELVEDQHLSRRVDEVLVGRERRSRFLKRAEGQKLIESENSPDSQLHRTSRDDCSISTGDDVSMKCDGG